MSTIFTGDSIGVQRCEVLVQSVANNEATKTYLCKAPSLATFYEEEKLLC